MEKQLFDDLILALLVETSWEEEYGAPRSWKGYDFNSLGRLEEEGFVFGNHRAKSICLSPEGIERGKLVLKALESLDLPPAPESSLSDEGD